MLVVFFVLKIGVTRPFQTGFFEWIKVVIGVEVSRRASDLVIALLSHLPQYLPIAGIIENFPDNFFNLFVEM